MKGISLLITLLIASSLIFAKSNFIIQPKGYIETNIQSQSNKNSGSLINKVGGHFRLKEYSSTLQQTIETDVVTYFLQKTDDGLINFHINCAKPIQLHFTFSDTKSKHDVQVIENSPYQRLNKAININNFKDGICTINIYNEKKELIHSIEFEKLSIK